MALNYVKGIISHMGDVQQGTSQGGYDWARQVIVIDVASFNNTFSKIAVTAQNQRVDELQNYQIGDRVEVGYSVTAREYQGKWFNNVDLINIKFLDEVAQAAPNPAPRQAARAMAAGQFTPPAPAAPAAQPAARRVARPNAPHPIIQPGTSLDPQSDDLPF